MLPARTFLIPAVLITGSGSSEKVGEEGKKLGVKKALIVTDQVMVKLGVLEGIKKALEQTKIQFAIYDAVVSGDTRLARTLVLIISAGAFAIVYAANRLEHRRARP